LFDLEEKNNNINNNNSKNINRFFPIGFQNPITMPMIMIKPRKNLKGINGPNTKTPIDVFKGELLKINKNT